MSDNDLIRRGVIKERMIARGWKHPDSTVTEFVEDDLPAVPHEMTAREFANEFRRMCDAYLNCMEDGDDCPLYTANICSLSEMENIVPIVEQWAKEHPEERSE